MLKALSRPAGMKKKDAGSAYVRAEEADTQSVPHQGRMERYCCCLC